jgi:tetratricopeptide (TPR) repeat protein
MFRKWAMVWNAYEVSDVESQYVFADYSQVLRIAGRGWHFGILAPLSAVGIVATWHARRRLWLWYALAVAMAAAVAAFYVMGRYRFPLVPLLIPFAAAGLEGLRRRTADRVSDRGPANRPAAGEGIVAVPMLQGNGLRAAVAAGIVAAVAANWPIHDRTRLDALSWMNVGVSLARDGDVAAAVPYFRRAVDQFPESAEANNNLAQALAVTGRFADAIPHSQAALRAAPDLRGVHFNLAVALEKVSRTGDAITHYQRAVQEDPADAAARAALARLQGQ